MSGIHVPVFGLLGRFFDRRVAPVQLLVERALLLPLGQSVNAVARKR
jgi:hypothetical protein